MLDRAVAAGEYATREAALVEACEALAARHNAAGLTAEVDPRTPGLPRTRLVPGPEIQDAVPRPRWFTT